MSSSEAATISLFKSRLGPYRLRRIAATSSLILGLLWIAFASSFDTQDRFAVYQDARLFNLTKAAIPFDILYAPAGSCSDRPCAHYAKTSTLPMREFPLVGIGPDDLFFARATVNLPDELRHAHEALHLHALYIWGRHIKVWIDGQLVADQSGPSLLSVPIPEEGYRDDGVITIDFEVDPRGLAFQGVANRRDLVIAPASLLAQLDHAAHDLAYTKYLGFILQRAAFFVLFSLLLLTGSSQSSSYLHESLAFLGFAFVETSAVFLDSGYARDFGIGGHRLDLWQITTEAIAFATLTFFIVLFTEAPRTLRRIVAISVMVFSLILLLYTGLATQLGRASSYLQIVRSLVIGATISIGILTCWLYLRRVRSDAADKKPYVWLLGIYLLVCLISSAPYRYSQIFGKFNQDWVFISQFAEFGLYIIAAMVAIAGNSIQITRERRQSARLNGVMLTVRSLAHDMRRPFSMLRSSFVALREVDDPTVLRAKLDRLEKDLERAASRVDGMLRDIMDAEVSTPANLRTSPLGPIIAGALTERGYVAISPDTRLYIDIGHLLAVDLDRERLGRAIGNIFENALQALPAAGGEVWVSTRDEGHEGVSIKIGNSGSLIPAVHLAEIFEPFFTRGKRDSNGLGLAVARSITERHGGTLTAASSVALGTEFTLTLPAHADASCDQLPLKTRGSWSSVYESLRSYLEGPQSEGPTAARLVRSVVVVDDDIFVREAWSLELADLALKTFANPAAFCAYFEAHPDELSQVDCLVLDRWFDDPAGHLPPEDGLALARSLLALLPNLPIIISSDATRLEAGSSADGLDHLRWLPKKTLTATELAHFLAQPT